jgi:D,D-heptose 1,7-bisphosphate phosphatase
MTINQVIILVGGKGSRLGVRTADTPKPMMGVSGRPFLRLLIDEVARHGFRDIVLLCGYLADRISSVFDNMIVLNARVRCVKELQPMGTGGALKQAEYLLDDQFLLLNGDSFFDFNLLDLQTFAENDAWLCKVALRPLTDTGRYGSVTLDGKRVISFAEKVTDGPGLINGGVYMLRREVLDYIHSIPCSLESEILPKLAAEGKLFGFAYSRFFIDIGIPEDLHRAQLELPICRPTIFFDGDGVLNHDAGYTHRVENFRWISGATEAIKLCNDRGWLVIVATNQAGVARGYHDVDALQRLHAWMQEDLRKVGAHIDAFYYCPHHLGGELPALAIECDCRKPKTEMLLQALEDWPMVDKGRSSLIGDKLSDIEAANRAGLRGVLFEGNGLLALVTNIVNQSQPEKIVARD